MAKAYEDYNNGYLPMTEKRHEATNQSDRIMRCITIAYQHGLISRDMYDQARVDLEKLSGVKWS